MASKLPEWKKVNLTEHIVANKLAIIVDERTATLIELDASPSTATGDATVALNLLKSASALGMSNE